MDIVTVARKGKYTGQRDIQMDIQTKIWKLDGQKYRSTDGQMHSAED
jgi:hypothetical protein